MAKTGTSIKEGFQKRTTSSRASSSEYVSHFRFFGIDPSGKTIRSLVLELKEKVNEDFIRRCHFQTRYQFNEFRLTRNYKMQRELREHLLQLSTWLFKGTAFPVSLKKELNRSLRFRNPYHGFDLRKVTGSDLENLNPVTLSVLHNSNLKQLFPDASLQKRLKAEYEKRKIETSNVDLSRKIEIIKRDRKFLLRNL